MGKNHDPLTFLIITPCTGPRARKSSLEVENCSKSLKKFNRSIKKTSLFYNKKKPEVNCPQTVRHYLGAVLKSIFCRLLCNFDYYPGTI
jgi:hypothetical protein